MNELARFVSVFSVSLFLAALSLYTQGYAADALLLLVIAGTAIGVLTLVLALARKRFSHRGDD